MTIEIKAPAFPESVADGVVAAWHKKPGESVARDELLVEIETDKVVMEVVAPEPGVIEAILVPEGETIASEALLATLVAGAAEAGEDQSGGADDAAQPRSAVMTPEDGAVPAGAVPMGPAVRALLEEHGLDAQRVSASGKGGRLLKEDVLAHLAQHSAQGSVGKESEPRDALVSDELDVGGATSERIEKRVPMSRMRARIAERLLGATQQTAIDRKSTRLNSSHSQQSRMPSSA